MHKCEKQYILCSFLMCIAKARITTARNAGVMLVEKDVLHLYGWLTGKGRTSAVASTNSLHLCLKKTDGII